MRKTIISGLITIFMLISISFANNCNINYLKSNYSNFKELVYSTEKGFFAFRIKKNGKYYVIKNGIEYGPYKSISKLTLSPSGDIFAYVVRKENGKYTAVINNNELDFNLSRIYSFYFSNNGKRYAIKAKDNNGKQIAIVDGKKVLEADEIIFITFSPDSKEYAIVFKNNGISQVLYNGEKINKYYEYITGVGFKNGFKILAKKGQDYVIYSLNNNSEKTYSNAKAYYSNSRNSFALEITQDGRYYMLFENEKGKLYDNIDSVKFINNNLTYAGSKNFKWTMVINNKEGKYYDNVFSPIFSKDSKNYIYPVKQNGQYYLIINGTKKYGPYHKISNFNIYKNNTAWIIKNKNNQTIIYKNGKKIGDYNTSYIKFSINGYLVFTYNKNSKVYIYFKGKNFGPYEKINNLTTGLEKVSYSIPTNGLRNIYENGKKVTELTDIKKVFYIKDNLFVLGNLVGDGFGLYKLNCNLNNRWIDTKLKERYKKAIIKRFLAKIKKLSDKRKKLIANKIDIIIDKIIKNPKYDEKTKIRKVSLFTAFKEVILKY